MALPAGIRRQLRGATPRIFETAPRRSETGDYVAIRDGEGELVMDRLNEGLRGSRVIIMEVRTEILDGDSMEIRAGPGTLFAPFQHYHLRTSTGNRQDSVWVVNDDWDSVYSSWTDSSHTDETGTSLRGMIRADGRLVLRVWFIPAPSDTLRPRGYSLAARTPMDFDNPDH